MLSASRRRHAVSKPQPRSGSGSGSAAAAAAAACRRDLQSHSTRPHYIKLSLFYIYKPIGASPGRDYEDGISTKNLVLNILWCRVGNYIEKGGERSAGYGLIERF